MFVRRGADPLNQGMGIAVYCGALVDGPGGDKPDGGFAFLLIVRCPVDHFAIVSFQPC